MQADPAAGGLPGAAAWRARVVVSGDVDEHAAQLSGWQQEYDQLGGGPFTGHLEEAVGDGVQIFRERTSRSLRQRCQLWPQALWCGITLADDGSRLNGRAIGAGAVMASGSDGSFELVSPAGHDIVGFVISRQALAQLGGGSVWPEAAQAGCWRIDPALRRAALVHARALLALAGHGAEEVLRASMLNVAADLLATREPLELQRERANARARRHLVARARERVLAEPGRVPGVPELCGALHVSRRSLQYAFEQEVGIGPLAYLRSLRLNGVRRMLRRADPAMTVQQAAAQWGFWDLSAFAADYRRQFGERASQTLARSTAATSCSLGGIATTSTGPTPPPATARQLLASASTGTTS